VLGCKPLTNNIKKGDPKMWNTFVNFVWDVILIAGAASGLYLIHTYLVYIGFYTDALFYLG
jgi:hypothetical protein